MKKNSGWLSSILAIALLFIGLEVLERFIDSDIFVVLGLAIWGLVLLLCLSRFGRRFEEWLFNILKRN